MKTQNYSNHIRYYAPHHFIFLPVSLGFCIANAIYANNHPEKSLEFWAIAVAFFLIFALAVLLRQHYALGNQNRIVRLELRLRYFQLTGSRLEQVEDKLSINQIAALRFASDQELEALVNRAVSENLSPDIIKRSVKNWHADYMRL